MAQSTHLRKYGVQTTIDFEVYEVDGVDLRVDWVPAAADCEVMKDEGASTQCTNTATDEGSTYSIVLTATEMQAARLVLKVVDAATKVFLDKVIVIETYGNASAQHAMDFDDAVRGGMTALPNAAADAAGGLPISDAGGLDLDAMNTAAVRLTAVRAAVLTDWIDAGRLDALLDAIPTTAMRGTDSAATEAKQDIIDANVDQIEAAVITNAAGTDVAADIIALKAETALIVADTNELQGDDIPGKLGAAADTDTATDIANIKARVDALLDTFGIIKNTALTNFEFLMVDSTDHFTPKTGLTITATRSIDGGAFASMANSASELSNGIYKINLAQADTNGNVITWRFTASGADDTFVTIRTTST
ncbi:hypothetical protein LCGC14_0878540 [marine sediment metagenome]|uniref:Uncharacterized protein n=1 Tax=marine sediment metagenome TaxID=412755 RepID=A0A0F9S9K6_9ZZZZ|nr:hypothetical protein [Phycisphaerae bacterium]